MKPDFNHIPNDSGTTVIFEQLGFFDDIPVCYQSWQYHNTSGESIVFLKKDLENHKDTDLISQVKASKLLQIGSPITLSRNPPEYLFINFNFSVKRSK